jgi:RNA 2',3'-cyclic 3'-phosphodiesterase
MIRTFLAIELPHTLKDRLSSLEPEFPRYAAGLKWSPPDLLHITLRFIGDVPETRLPAVMGAAQEAAGRAAPFSLTLSHLGSFPTARKPRVIWIGLEAGEGLDALNELFADIEAGLLARGFPAETRPFSPHVTLARTRDTLPESERRELGTLLAEVADRTAVEGTISVQDLTVMRSDLGRTGPRYTPLERYPLLHAATREKEVAGSTE